MVALRGWSPGERHNDAVPFVVLRETRSGWQEGVAPCLGQRQSWHTSKEVREWITSHNRQVKRSGCGVRILPCLLPKKSPWLNPIEPKWIHGKRRVVQADGGLLSAHELADRVCAAFSTVRITSI